MSVKYEVVEIDSVELTVDVSMLQRSEEMFFNATEMAKPFGKKVNDFLRIETTKEYIDAIFKVGDSRLKNYEDLVQIKKGKYGGTWLHNELSFEFAGWCSAIFRRSLHKWVESKLNEEQSRKNDRLAAKTGYLPLTQAISAAHDPAEFYHFSTEADLINRIVLGMSAKKFKSIHGVESVRDACTAAQIKDLRKIQEMNTTLIDLGYGYQERKDELTAYFDKAIKKVCE